MTEQQTSERITEEVSGWPGVTAGPGTRGELSFNVGRREIGHLHGDRVAHFGSSRRTCGRDSSSKAGSTTTPSLQ
jgi:Family of unknown function (DUF5519)